MAQQTKELLRILSMDAMILGLALIALSKDKVEDEITLVVRRSSIAGSFAFAVAYVIIMPFIDLANNDPIAEIKGQQLVLLMLSLYLTQYYIERRRVRSQAENR